MRPFYRRTFLNRRGHHKGAYVLADVNVERGTTTSSAIVDAWLTISDCDRVTTLDFYASTRDEIGNAVHKAQVLRDVVVAFTEALECAVVEWEATTAR